MLVIASLVIGVVLGTGPAIAASGGSADGTAAASLPRCAYLDIKTRFMSLDRWRQTSLDTRLRVGRKYAPTDLVPVGRADIPGSGKVRRLVIEDLDVDTYELDGRLTQLRNAGKLAQAAGIVVGEMKDVGWRFDKAAFMQDMSIEDVLEEVIGPLGVPCIYGLPIGHGKHHVTVPHGALATFDADAGTLVIDEVVTADD